MGSSVGRCAPILRWRNWLTISASCMYRLCIPWAMENAHQWDIPLKLRRCWPFCATHFALEFGFLPVGGGREHARFTAHIIVNISPTDSQPLHRWNFKLNKYS